MIYLIYLMTIKKKKKHSDIHCYQTRHVNDLNLTRNKNHCFDHSVRTSGLILWNNLEEKKKSVKQLRIQYNQTLSQIIIKLFLSGTVFCLVY